ncbi:hypothetical protein BX265_1593 [Streptomyces sp. TLI_235]|nr:hypothetical protein BX265_1593 [Streptomyces sp. TLI_235]
MTATTATRRSPAPMGPSLAGGGIPGTVAR